MAISSKLVNFKNEIYNGIEEISNSYIANDPKLEKTEYGFLYWILLKLYNVDEEVVPDCITEYQDKSIDCFVHFEDNKELYIIQCKYYDIDGVVKRNDVSDFLQMPLTALLRGDYKKSKKLQKIFSSAINDPEYKIYLQFYSTSTHVSDDIIDSIKRFNGENHQYKALLRAEFIDLEEIYDKYYGQSYKEKKTLTFNIGTVSRGTFASLREEYKIEGLKCEAYYIITPVSEIYRLKEKSKKDGYQLFEENIREFLGDSSVNKGIIDTLRGEEKNNFLFYNNGITLICSHVGRDEMKNGMRYIPLENPQVVNGCQTVSSIHLVLDSYNERDMQQIYQNVFVMVKVLVIPDKTGESKTFYRNVVKYTNRQNSVPDKAFLSNEQSVFARIQSEFERRGFYLRVKQSDKAKFDDKEIYSDNKKAKMLADARHYVEKIGVTLKSSKDICIDIEKLLQVILAYVKDGYYGYTKKSNVLNKSSDIFKTITVNIQDYLSIDNMIKLYYVYKRAEQDQKKSDDKRTPIPYYVIGFMSYQIKGEKNSETMNKQLNKIFALDSDGFNKIYECLCFLSNRYRENLQNEGVEYNVMIKQKIDDKSIEEAVSLGKKYICKDALQILSDEV